MAMRMALEMGLHAPLETIDKPFELKFVYESAPEAFSHAWWAVMVDDL